MNDIVISPENVRIETFKVESRGRWDNDSGVRLIYLPTGKKFESTFHKSQHKNRNECFQKLQRWLIENPELITLKYQAKIYIVLMRGPEWSIIKGLYDCESAAKAEVARLELNALKSGDFIERNSEYIISEENLNSHIDFGFLEKSIELIDNITKRRHEISQAVYQDLLYALKMLKNKGKD